MNQKPLYLAYYALPAALAGVAFYILIPLLKSAGLADFPAYLTALALPLGTLLAGALWTARRAGYLNSWRALTDGLRYRRMDRDGWRGFLGALGWSIGGSVLISAGLQLVNFYRWLPLPAGLLPIQDPRVTASAEVMQAAWGGDLHGKWGLLLIFLLWLVIFNTLGEELWFRGILLQLHEEAHGSRAWLIQGGLWALFHLFKYWAIPGLLPMCFALPYMSQKLKNNTPALLAHLLINCIALLPLAMAVFGA